MQRAIDEMRALAHGVFPPALVDFGPVEALRESVRSAAIPTTIRAANVRRYSSEVERAAGLGRLEALQNAYKHASTVPLRASQSLPAVANSPSRSPTTGPDSTRPPCRTVPDCETCATASPRSADPSPSTLPAGAVHTSPARYH